MVCHDVRVDHCILADIIDIELVSGVIAKLLELGVL